MKKYLFGWMTIALMAFVCAGFAACSSDDDNDGDGGGGSASASGLVGTWKRTYKQEVKYGKDASGNWQKIKDQEKFYDDDKGSSGYLFKADGKAQLLDNVKADGTYEVEEEFKYKVENGHLYMIELDHPDGWEDAGKITISGNTFELQEEEIEGDEKEVETKRYKKI